MLLVRRGRGAYLGRWSLPGGKVEPGEPLGEALVREFAEETGLTVEIRRLAGVTEAIEPEGAWHYVIISYFVEVIGGAPAAGDDADELRWVERNELPDLELTPHLELYLNQFGCWDG